MIREIKKIAKEDTPVGDFCRDLLTSNYFLSLKGTKNKLEYINNLLETSDTDVINAINRFIHIYNNYDEYLLELNAMKIQNRSDELEFKQSLVIIKSGKIKQNDLKVGLYVDCKVFPMRTLRIFEIKYNDGEVVFFKVKDENGRVYSLSLDEIYSIKEYVNKAQKN